MDLAAAPEQEEELEEEEHAEEEEGQGKLGGYAMRGRLD